MSWQLHDGDYIEVTGSSIIVRPIEMLRATITIRVTTRKSEAAFAVSVKLKDRVVAALCRAGIKCANIEDLGCSVGHSKWSLKKQLTHKLNIWNNDVQVFETALTAVEQVFSDARTGHFSGTSCDFSFVEAEPIYKNTEEANEVALSHAYKNAVAKATIIAERANLMLMSATAVNEVFPVVNPTLPDAANASDPMNFDSHLAVQRDEAEAIDEFPAFTQRRTEQVTGVVQLRVRFSAVQLPRAA